MVLNENYTLSNGVKIPKIGLGTWLIPDGEAAQAVRDAVAMGYRHIEIPLRRTETNAAWARACAPVAFRARKSSSPARLPRSTKLINPLQNPLTKALQS